MKIKIEIKHWISGAVLFEYDKEENTIRDTVLEAIRQGADLSSADLRSANLRYANLRSADLSSADLRSANLSSANLSSADLRSANLRSADLRYANLRSADLSSADLRSADLRYANLRSADLRSANLRSADLSSADLRSANLSSADLRSADLSSANLSSADLRSANLRSANLSSADLYGMTLDKLPQDFINQCSRDILFILGCLKAEVPALRKSLIDGKVDGTQYQGECACLIGTLANADGGLEKVCSAIPFYERGTHNYGEMWFLNIREGDTPETNEFSKHAVLLCDMVVPPKQQARRQLT
jgi:uncharacterized protein YjbI with pentapeptide repeats